MFKNEMFGHAFLSQNPELFSKIFDDMGLDPKDEEDINWEVPESPEDAIRMINEIRAEMEA